MASSSPDAHKISLNIINAIKQHPVLYIPEIKGTAVKPQEFRQKVWKRISNELGLDTSWIKFRWKNLRDTYCRILKSKNKSNGLKKKKWMFEKHLEFLKITYEDNCNFIELSEDYINDINSEDVRPSDLTNQLEENEENDDYDEFLEVLEENDDMVSDSSPEQSNNNDTKSKVVESHDKRTLKRAMSEDSDVDQHETKLECSQSKNIKLDNFSTKNLILLKKPAVQDIKCKKKTINISDTKKSFDYDTSIDNFFHSIAENVKKLPPKVQADIKMDVSKIVSEAEFSFLKQNTLQGIQKYSNMPGMIKKLVLVPCHIIDQQTKTDKY